MKTDVLLRRSAAGLALLALAGLMTACSTQQAGRNPIDPVSNPDKLSYPDVEMKIPDYDEPFKRDGVMTQPERFRQIVPGMPAAEVERLIGKPLEVAGGASGREWNYDFTFILPRSQNYLVCQYKVVFDGAQQVSGSAWRRHQCLDIVNNAG